MSKSNHKCHCSKKNSTTVPSQNKTRHSSANQNFNDLSNDVSTSLQQSKLKPENLVIDELEKVIKQKDELIKQKDEFINVLSRKNSFIQTQLSAIQQEMKSLVLKLGELEDSVKKYKNDTNAKNSLNEELTNKTSILEKENIELLRKNERLNQLLADNWLDIDKCMYFLKNSSCQNCNYRNSDESAKIFLKLFM